jgi:hypothetical protein
MYKILSIISLTVILSLLCESCSSKSNSSFNRLFGIETFAYGELKVTEQWQEIGLAKPISSGSPVRFIVLQIKDGENWQGFGEKNVRSPQGEIINVEAQLIDEEGKTYELKTYFGRPEQIHLSVNYERGKGGEEFPKPILGNPTKDVTFTKLKIKSNYHFTCSEIYWESRF